MSIVDDARRDYLAMLSERRQAHENTKEETIRKNPSLLEIRKEISRIYTDEIRGLHNADETDRLVADAEKRFEAEAERLGLAQTVGDYVPLCAECSDTGIAGGKQCRCVTRHIIEKCYGEGYSSEYASRPGADSFDTEIYGKEEYRKLAAKDKRAMLKYISEFGASPANLAIIGVPGSGKTLIARIICSELIAKGCTVMCLAAYRIVEIFQEEMFSGEESGMKSLAESCDLLVIDDLGTERQTNFTENLMFELIDTRFRAGLPTIITTNLSSEKQKEYYGARIFSRFYSRCNTVITTPGEDIRLKVNILK
ncbi:MAG: ATP-binding protein [Eubacteriaceae bacterium]|nr:ATP-binding protein [Eubacteriaceae bacterium]